MNEALRLERLQAPSGRVRMVLDTDTYNEIDDQFAVAHALLSPDELDIKAIYAAPFHNANSSGPEDGMEKSYAEILRLLERLEVSAEDLVFKGATSFLPANDQPVESEAACHLVEQAMADDKEPLYVVDIGAITNVASAILLEPRIIGRIVVVWLGGHALHWPHTKEFNLRQDMHASKLILDCGVPLVLIPCMGVASHLLTTGAEIDQAVRGRGAIGDYLASIFHAYQRRHQSLSKVIWDISATAYLIDHTWVPSELVHSPVLSHGGTWSVDRSRHLVRVASFVHRDPIFADLFKKLAARSGA